MVDRVGARSNRTRSPMEDGLGSGFLVLSFAAAIVGRASRDIMIRNQQSKDRGVRELWLRPSGPRSATCDSAKKSAGRMDHRESPKK